jgi:hypothetical protein
MRNVVFILKEAIKFPGGKEFLRRVLKKIGFKFRKCKNEWSFLMEGNDIVAQRATYLRIMKKSDELGSNKKLVYVDRMWFHLTYTAGKHWQDSKTESVIQQCWSVTNTCWFREGICSRNIPDF